ncbi:hypothetical protein L9F63_008848 [Diploptera punctata]|uniref:Uncharacterized protein n=1 Tax=Diploptera punctata TaxID=6984 RepID=A0AAD7Z4X4_DIPPU|nr:hypothetical protein L9F63_008848 [Diploptera punctata]
MSVTGASIPESLAMSIAKKNPYRHLINYNLQVMHHNGVLKRLRQGEWPTKLPSAAVPWNSVTFNNVAPLLLILSVGLGTSIIFLIIEKCTLSLIKMYFQDPNTLKIKILSCNSIKIKQ